MKKMTISLITVFACSALALALMGSEQAQKRLDTPFKILAEVSDDEIITE